MEIWLTHKLRSTFEIEPTKPYFILQSLLLTRNIVSSPLANTCGRNSLSPSKHSVFFCSPSLSTFRTKSCPPPSRKGGWLILYYLSPLLNIGYARHVDEIISNQRQNRWQGCWQVQWCPNADLRQWKLAKPWLVKLVSWKVIKMVGSKQGTFGNCPLQNAGKWHFNIQWPTFLS